MIRIGKVSSVNRKSGTVQVVYNDRDDMVSDDLPMLSFEFNMPEPEDMVVCVFLDNAPESGFCLGKFYNEHVRGVHENVIRKRFCDDDAYVEYKKETGDIVVKNAKGKIIIEEASSMEINGNITIKGDITVTGNISATGTVLDTEGNSNHHVH